MADEYQAASAYVELKPSMRGFHQRVQAEVRGTTVTQRVEPEIDTAALEKAQAKLQAAADKVAAARRKEADAAGSVRTAEAALAVTRDQGNARADRLVAMEERVERARRAAAASTEVLERAERARLGAQRSVERIEAQVDVDTSGATRTVDNWVTRMSGRMLRVGVDVDKNSLSQSIIGVAALSRALKTLAMPVALIAATPYVLSFAGSLVQAAGAGALLPAVLGAGALAAGTLAVGLGGLGETLKALTAADEAAAVGAAAAGAQRVAAAKAVAGARQALERAQTHADRAEAAGRRQVQDAEEAAADAIKRASADVVAARARLVDAGTAVVRAEADLHEARRQAIRDLQDLSEQVSDNALTIEGAEIGLLRAQERQAKVNAEATATDLDRREAALNVAEAQDRLSDAHTRAGRDQEALNEAERRGVNGSRDVLAAQFRLNDANRDHRAALAARQEAVEALTRAERNGARDVADARTQSAQAQADAALSVADAQRQLTDALTETGVTADAAGAKAALAFAALSPAGQALITMLRGLGPAWTAVRLDVQERLLAGIGTRIGLLAGNYLPMLQGALGVTADGYNRAGRAALDWLNTKPAMDDMRFGLDNVALGLNNSSGAMTPLLRAWNDFFVVGSTFLPGMGTGITGLAERFAVFTAQARESGRIREWIQGGIDAIKQLWQLLVNVGGIFGSVFDGARVSGEGFLAMLTRVSGDLNAYLKTPEGAAGLRDFFITVRDVVGFFIDKLVQLWPVLAAAGGAFGALLVSAEPLSSLLFTLVTFALVPLLNLIGLLAPILGPVLVAIGAIALATKAWAAVQVLLNLALWKNPTGLIILALTALVAGLVWAYQNSEMFRNIVDAAFRVIGAVIGFVWDNVIKPVFGALVWFIQSVIVPVILFLWRNIFEPGFRAIGAVIAFVWNTVIKPVWDMLVWVIQNIITPAVLFLWHRVIQPAFDGIGSVISFVWNRVIRPAWDAMVGGLRWLGDHFTNTVNWIGDIWNRLRGFLARPINFLIDVVWNRGILRAWNAVAGLLPGINPIQPLALIPEFAQGGAVYGPGTTTSDSIPARLSRDEHVWTAREVRGAGGHDQIEELRDAARRGTLRYFAGGGPVLGFAGGGPVYRQLFSLVRGAFPNATLNSGYRPGDPGFHGRSKAVDLGTQGRSGGLGHPGLAGMNRWIHDTYGKGSAELIYDGLGDDRPDIYRGRPHTYNPGTRADHRNHVHWAVGDMRDLGGGGLLGAIGGAIGGVVSYFRDKVAGIFRDITDPLRGMIDRTVGAPPPAFKAVPGAMFTKFRDAALGFLTSKADEQDMASGDVGLGGYGKGAPFYVKEIARAGRAAGVGRAGNVIGTATAIVESGLRMYANRRVPASFNFPHEAVGSDHDSVGLFQQRQAGWGTLAQRMNPFGSAMLFFNALNKFNWRAMAPGPAAQRVQRSAFPSRYATRMGEAGRLLDIHAGGGFDDGGVARGRGFLLKDVIAPERTLSPRQTEVFEEELVPLLTAMAPVPGPPAPVLTAAQHQALTSGGFGGDGELRPIEVYGAPGMDVVALAEAVRRRDHFDRRIGATG